MILQIAVFMDLHLLYTDFANIIKNNKNNIPDLSQYNVVICVLLVYF